MERTLCVVIQRDFLVRTEDEDETETEVLALAQSALKMSLMSGAKEISITNDNGEVTHVLIPSSFEGVVKEATESISVEARRAEITRLLVAANGNVSEASRERYRSGIVSGRILPDTAIKKLSREIKSLGINPSDFQPK